MWKRVVFILKIVYNIYVDKKGRNKIMDEQQNECNGLIKGMLNALLIEAGFIIVILLVSHFLIKL